MGGEGRGGEGRTGEGRRGQGRRGRFLTIHRQKTSSRCRHSRVASSRTFSISSRCSSCNTRPTGQSRAQGPAITLTALPPPSLVQQADGRGGAASPPAPPGQAHQAPDHPGSPHPHANHGSCRWGLSAGAPYSGHHTTSPLTDGYTLEVSGSWASWTAEASGLWEPRPYNPLNRKAGPGPSMENTAAWPLRPALPPGLHPRTPHPCAGPGGPCAEPPPTCPGRHCLWKLKRVRLSVVHPKGPRQATDTSASAAPQDSGPLGRPRPLPLEESPECGLRPNKQPEPESRLPCWPPPPKAAWSPRPQASACPPGHHLSRAGRRWPDSGGAGGSLEHQAKGPARSQWSRVEAGLPAVRTAL